MISTCWGKISNWSDIPSVSLSDWFSKTKQITTTKHKERMCGMLFVCMCVCVFQMEKGAVFSSRALIVVQMTGFREPFSSPNRCHTGLKNVWCAH